MVVEAHLVNLLKCKIMHVGSSSTVEAYTLSDGSGECVQSRP